MFTAVYQSIILLGIIASFNIMDFLLIHRFDRSRQASGAGRARDFTHAAKAGEELLSQNLPEYSAYMARTSRFLPRLWRGK